MAPSAASCSIPGTDCADDAGEFLEAQDRFAQVHIAPADTAMERRLEGALGRKVTINGNAFAAHTRHHRRPMVVIAEQLSVIKR